MVFEDFKLKIIVCPKCKKKMIDAKYWNLYCAFPVYYKKQLKVQLTEKDMVIRSETKEDDIYLCRNCEDLMEFECFGCKETRLKKDIKSKYGDLPEFLCKQCFETKTAKEWDILYRELYKRHQWDYD